MNSEKKTIEEEELHTKVKKQYGEVLSKTNDLKICACVATQVMPKIFRDILMRIPREIQEKFYGCGNPIPLGITGLTLLDLGSGSGRDCQMAAPLVGPKGMIYGVDMTPQQLEVANKQLQEQTKDVLKFEKPNMQFLQGQIELLSSIKQLKNESIDIAISNCVINLCPDKRKALQEVQKLLKIGGEFQFSDVYCDRRLPEKLIKNEILHGECVSGAMQINDFLQACKEVGFSDPRMLEKKPIPIDPNTIDDEETQKLLLLLGSAKFQSITYRLFKLKNLEPNCEDYGQYAIYLGNINGYPSEYKLDDHHIFEKDKPKLVCGNTAAMLEETWLKQQFKVVGNKSVHYGQFPCESAPKEQENKGGPCGGGTCGGGPCG